MQANHKILPESLSCTIRPDAAARGREAVEILRRVYFLLRAGVCMDQASRERSTMSWAPAEFAERELQTKSRRYSNRAPGVFSLE